MKSMVYFNGRYILLLLFLSTTALLKAQGYYSYIKKAENAITDSSYSVALTQYEAAFSKYKGAPVDIFNALHCANILQKEEEIYHLLESYYSAGGDEDLFSNPFLSEMLKRKRFEDIKVSHKKLSSDYLAYLNSGTINEIRGMVEQDQVAANDKDNPRYAYLTDSTYLKNYNRIKTMVGNGDIKTFRPFNGSSVPMVLLRHYGGAANRYRSGLDPATNRYALEIKADTSFFTFICYLVDNAYLTPEDAEKSLSYSDPLESYSLPNKYIFTLIDSTKKKSNRPPLNSEAVIEAYLTVEKVDSAQMKRKLELRSRIGLKDIEEITRTDQFRNKAIEKYGNDARQYFQLYNFKVIPPFIISYDRKRFQKFVDQYLKDFPNTVLVPYSKSRNSFQ